ncbi:MAG: hypothetical protein RLZ52_423 [Pseudomonadota bacterium]|jgi:hypothetical protein
MFYNNHNVEKIAHKVYIYRNFVSKENLDKINKILKEKEEKESLSKIVATHTIDWYHDKFTESVPELYEIWEDLNKLLLPEYCVHPCLTLLRTKPGDGGMYHHADSPGEDMEEELIASDIWNTCCVIHYGAIVYFGEWEGGEVYYPNLDKEGNFVGNFDPFNKNNGYDGEFMVKPNPGDLIIHGAHSDTCHGVHEITSGIRYAFSNFVVPVEKHPGTFPTYGTKENEDRWNSMFKNVDGELVFTGEGDWLSPINFNWEPSEKLKSEIESGITGIRHRDL